MARIQISRYAAQNGGGGAGGGGGWAGAAKNGKDQNWIWKRFFFLPGTGNVCV